MAPAYPAEAKAAGVSGKVAAQVTISEKGQVIEAIAVSGPDMPEGDHIAIVRRVVGMGGKKYSNLRLFVRRRRQRGLEATRVGERNTKLILAPDDARDIESFVAFLAVVHRVIVARLAIFV